MPHPAPSGLLVARRGRLLLLGMGLVAWSCSWQPVDETPPRPLAAPREQKLAAGESHTLSVELRAGQTLRVEVEQRGIDVVVGLADPEGNRLLSVDSPTGRRGAETLAYEAEVSGEHRVRIEAFSKEVMPGSYVLRLEELAGATPRDRRRREAELAMTAAGERYTRGTVEDQRRALESYREALGLWRSVGRRREEARTLFCTATLSRSAGEWREALELYRHSLGLWRDLGDQGWQAMVLNNLGLTHRDLGEMEEARTALNEALAFWRSVGDPFAEANTRSNLCLTAQDEGELHRALTCYRQVLPRFQELGEETTRARLLISVGVLAYRLGEPQQAFDVYEEALGLHRRLGNRREQAYTLNNLALLYRGLGESEEARILYEQALAVFLEVGDRAMESTTLHNLGVVYLSLGEPRRALPRLEQALELQVALEDTRRQATTLSNLAFAHQRMGDLEKALHLDQESLDKRRQVKDALGEGVTLKRLAATYAASGDFDSAVLHFDQALEVLRRVGDRRHLGRALYEKGRVLAVRGEPDKALVLLNQALDLLQAVKDRPGEAQALHALARAEKTLGRIEEARLHVEAALDVVESLRTRVTSPDLRASFLASKRGAYELYVEVLMELERRRPGEGHGLYALRASERGRARRLLDLLREAGTDLWQRVEPRLRERRSRLERRLNAKTNRQLRVLARDHTDEEARVAETQRLEALAELEDAEAAIRRSHPRSAPVTEPLGLEATRELLDADTLLVHYALGEPRSYLWAVTPSSFSVHELPGRRELEDAARRVYSQLRTLEAGAAETGDAAELAEVLLGPVAGELPGRNLVVVADGALHYLPFAALPIPGAENSSRNGRPPLVTRHQVVHLPSATALDLLRRVPRRTGPWPRAAAVLADPVFDPRDPRVGGGNSPATNLSRAAAGLALERLAWSAGEAEAIRSLAEREHSLFALGFGARRSLLVEGKLDPYPILHFATHSFVDDRRPGLSGLVLSRVDAEGRALPGDGFVRLRDLYGLRLEAGLVVLSGCRTALGREIRGEGLVGLTQGFMYAGVPRVVASLWRVQDRATAVFMERFYRALWQEGLAPAAALRRAQLSLRREEEWRDPYYWAPFVVQGDWR